LHCVSLLVLTGTLLAALNKAAAAPPFTDFPVVQGDAYLGVIVPADRVSDVVHRLGVIKASYWTPDPKVIVELEAKLRGALEFGLHSPDTLVPGLEPGREFDYVTSQIAEVLADLRGSRRQYIGIVLPDGSKRILVNGFPGAHDPASDRFPYWRAGIVSVNDGGASFWRIQYIVKEGRFTAFDSNGYA